jgi:hypothetical protein
MPGLEQRGQSGMDFAAGPVNANGCAISGSADRHSGARTPVGRSHGLAAEKLLALAAFVGVKLATLPSIGRACRVVGVIDVICDVSRRVNPGCRGPRLCPT